MRSPDADSHETADFFFEADGEPTQREVRLATLGLPPDNLERAGRPFKLRRLELITESGKPARTRTEGERTALVGWRGPPRDLRIRNPTMR
jgi:hypothetical protein